jgi:hypothetical protein
MAEMSALVEETQREVVIESLKADCEIRTGRPLGL